MVQFCCYIINVFEIYYSPKFKQRGTKFLILQQKKSILSILPLKSVISPFPLQNRSTQFNLYRKLLYIYTSKSKSSEIFQHGIINVRKVQLFFFLLGNMFELCCLLCSVIRKNSESILYIFQKLYNCGNWLQHSSHYLIF